ncbi:hypothetical protein ACE6H2_006514 [Prunus campanulata]
MVGHIHKKCISFSGINCRSREHPIYCNNGLRMAQPAHILRSNNKKSAEPQQKLLLLAVFLDPIVRIRWQNQRELREAKLGSLSFAVKTRLASRSPARALSVAARARTNMISK